MPTFRGHRLGCDSLREAVGLAYHWDGLTAFPGDSAHQLAGFKGTSRLNYWWNCASVVGAKCAGSHSVGTRPKPMSVAIRPERPAQLGPRYFGPMPEHFIRGALEPVMTLAR